MAAGRRPPANGPPSDTELALESWEPRCLHNTSLACSLFVSLWELDAVRHDHDMMSRSPFVRLALHDCSTLPDISENVMPDRLRPNLCVLLHRLFFPRTQKDRCSRSRTRLGRVPFLKTLRALKRHQHRGSLVLH